MQDAIAVHKNEMSLKNETIPPAAALTEANLLQLPRPSRDYTLQLYLRYHITPTLNDEQEMEFAACALYPLTCAYHESALVRCRVSQKGHLNLFPVMRRWIRFFIVLILATIISILNGAPGNE